MRQRLMHGCMRVMPDEHDCMSVLPNTYLQVLSDDNKKAIYDRYGEAGLKGGMGGFGGGGGGAQDFSNPFDLFESFFGQSMGGGFGGRAGSQRSRAIPGEDER